MKDERYQGVTPGIVMALHTWGRQLALHPHVHCVITGGGLDRGARVRQFASSISAKSHM